MGEEIVCAGHDDAKNVTNKILLTFCHIPAEPTILSII